jgi:diguanylate cyclase (GGDEF)-like protein
LSGHGPDRITVSIGVAEYPASGGDSTEVLQAADRALYQAKSEGRNRVVAAKRVNPELRKVQL